MESRIYDDDLDAVITRHGETAEYAVVRCCDCDGGLQIVTARHGEDIVARVRESGGCARYYTPHPIVALAELARCEREEE